MRATLSLLAILAAPVLAQPAPVASATVAPLISTARCAGHFQATIYRAGGIEKLDGVRLHVPDPLHADLKLGSLRFRLDRRPAENLMEGTAPSTSGLITALLEGGTAPVHSLSLTIWSRRVLSGPMVDPDGRRSFVVLRRVAMLPIPPAELVEHDPGPPPDFAAHFAKNPDYGTHKTAFWYAFGPVFYRGRLDGSAKVIVIASDPGPTECLPFVRRTLVGDAGQRVQGLLAKARLTRSYVCVNAFTVALRPSQVTKGKELLALPEQVAWRNTFYDMLVTPKVRAIVALGGPAAEAVKQWTTRPKHIPVIYAVHPSSKDPVVLAETYKKAVSRLRWLVPPDQGADWTLPNYGAELTELDYARIPRRDLPLEAPVFIGDDSWGRIKSPDPHNNCAVRPSPDDRVSVLFRNPDGTALRYRVVPDTAVPGGAPQFTSEPYLFPVPLE